MARPYRPPLLAVVLILALGGATACVLGAPPLQSPLPPESKVHPDVEAALASEGTVRVIAALEAPPALERPLPDIATLKAQVKERQASALAGLPAAEARVFRQYEAVPAFAAEVTADGLEALAARPDVVDVSLDYEGTHAAAQSVPLINADDAHTAGLTGDGVIVAVLDTGIDTDHVDLMDDIAYEKCFLAPGDCPSQPHVAEDDNGHGTNVSGIVTSNGTIAPKGVAPDAKIAAYKILGSNGSGRFSDWVAALDDIIANRPEVDAINMSLQSSTNCPSTVIGTAIATLRKLGKPVFVASGNHGNKGSLQVPACVPEALSVGATYDASMGSFTWSGVCTDTTTAADMVACWSDSHSSLDLVAPGARITSTGYCIPGNVTCIQAGGTTSTYRGTSQSSPHAAGVAALLLEAYPNLSVDAIELRMESAGVLVTDDLHDDNPNTNRTTPRVDGRVALLAPGVDTDGDGCTNGEEFGANEHLGGRRNPLNPYDFYDVNGDGVVNMLDDVLTVVMAFGSSSSTAYQAALDRSKAPPGADVWNMGPPDGVIDLATDIRGVAAQFGHTCAGP